MKKKLAVVEAFLMEEFEKREQALLSRSDPYLREAHKALTTFREIKDFVEGFQDAVRDLKDYDDRDGEGYGADDEGYNILAVVKDYAE